MPSTICRRIDEIEKKYGVKLNLDYHVDAQKMVLVHLDAATTSLEASYVKNLASYMTNDWPSDKGNEKRTRGPGGTAAVMAAEEKLKEKQQHEAIVRIVASAVLPQSLLPDPSKFGKPPVPVLRGTLSPSHLPSRRRASR